MQCGEKMTSYKEYYRKVLICECGHEMGYIRGTGTLYRFRHRVKRDDKYGTKFRSSCFVEGCACANPRLAKSQSVSSANARIKESINILPS